ncbi:hypothetical protein [Polaribacter sp. Hel_I_88]|uniref:hypothetical protein n=1 Tax=Polaribacter sp. Hel_I_88 TaxID=1250006 RepID=UPI000478DC4F|nr:hypothetical protein [Polaribacter sp. Hel_I_88]|tara:strand:+ start:425 stop:904 length:480 start_codon:yes stop_codon:yes gene_type:complete
MKKIKNIIVTTLILIGLFAFKKAEDTPILLKTAEKQQIIKILSAQEFGCRPSSEFNIYVETTLLKKYRGYAKIKAKVFVLDKLSNKKSMLVSEDVLVANYKDSYLNYNKLTGNSKTTELQNGDIIINENENTTFKLEDLLSYDFIYNRYTIATNKLLNI